MLFGMALGTWFSVGMVVFAGGAVLYHTSNVLHRYQPGQHVAAALSLFASVALMLWYMVQLFTSRR
jgi:FtsH-binding integral membrane protein